ncbi:alpha-glucosidase/alpha-galactosidase [Dictyoglomus thermophilum]|uniref:alpha-glucosidase/alpha-galactosidase n=1 Tax=Dictyoglomus thermophilum TaxID=14 RepID=UPI0011EAF2D5|nr:alpha-glucosidase/alpha-galactosidase [Dictyoglomus thermophilum]TYT23443.1 alpha-glucosidase/alpha-galactosidase [Dictyoglomus thermophilum]
MDNVKIAYIGGGSKGWAWKFMADLALEESFSGEVRLYDINFEAAKTNEIIGNRISEQKDAKSKWRYRAVKEIGEALDGADFVIISILPGTLDEMEVDVHLPEKYGIYQAVGDTPGPGGVIRSLRTIPIYIEFAEAIKKYAPSAWVINYTNPMALCVRTLYVTFPKVKAIGCCHEVFKIPKILSLMLKEKEGINADPSEIKQNVLGINHFTWVDKISYKNKDLLPVYGEFAEKYYEEGFEEEKDRWKRDYFASANRVKFDLYRRYKLIAAAGDRHLAEFFPANWYLENPERVREWKFSLTPVSFRREQAKELYEMSQKLAKGEMEFPIKPSGEVGVQIMKALLGLSDFITNVNYPNVGQMDNVPQDVIVETNVYITRDSIRPIYAGKLPNDVNSWVLRHIMNQEMILEAVLNKDLELAFRAFYNDPIVESKLDFDTARKLFKEMIEGTKRYLPKYFGGEKD